MVLNVYSKMQANVDEVQPEGSETVRSPVSPKRDEERHLSRSRILVSELEKECERLLRSAQIPSTLDLEEPDSELSRVSKLRNQTIRKFFEMVVGIQGGASISQKRTRFPQKTTNELLKCIKKQSSASLPTVEQRRRLCKSTGLSSKQVSLTAKERCSLRGRTTPAKSSLITIVKQLPPRLAQVKDWFTNYRRRRVQRQSTGVSSSSSGRSTSAHD